MINYSDFAKTDDVAFNISSALAFCQKHGEDGLSFQNGTYRIKSEFASEGVYSISNHCGTSLKKICFLLKGFENFTIDGGGSEFIFENIMTPVIIDSCKNVTVKNFSIFSENTLSFQAEVVDSGEDWFKMKMDTNLPYYVSEKRLFVGDKNGLNSCPGFFVECDGKTKRLVPDAGDYFMNGSSKIDFSLLDDGLVLAERVNKKMTTGHVLIFAASTRCSTNIFVNRSVNTKISGITFYSGIGMGVIGQNSDGIDIDDIATRLKPDRYFTLNADATHFVHCKGKINIRNSFFEGQLDDVLNVHSIYLRIVAKTANTILVKYMHHESRGVDIIEPGSIIRAVKTDTLLPYAEMTVKGVRIINTDYTEITLDSAEELAVGDNIEEVSWKPEVTFENCVVQNNRARGMLIASGGKTVIRNNTFRNPGAPIKFESDGSYWFESGGVGEVIITGNTFDNCKYTDFPGWGNAVIEVTPRSKTEEGKYYHNKISIIGNTFKNCHSLLAIINNTHEFTFTDNKLIGCIDNPLWTDHCGSVKTDI